MPVTRYQNATDTIGRREYLSQCLEEIRDDESLKKSVGELRALYSHAEELHMAKEESADAEAAYKAARDIYQKRKKNLPAFTISGTFTKRCVAGLKQYSGIIQADLDDLGSKGVNKVELKRQIEIDPNVLFCFESPSGDGLKCGIRVEALAEHHAEAFLAMQRYFSATYDIMPDGACKDVSRLCFLSSDENLFINENPVHFNWRAWPAPGMAESDEDVENSVDLPLDAFPSVIQQLAKSCAEVYQVDAAVPAVSALTILAAALGNNVNCEGAVNGRITPCNLFTAISAPSGYGKGVVAIVAKPLIVASAEITKRFEETERPQIRADIALAEMKKKSLMTSMKGDSLTAAGRDETRAELGSLEADIERWTLETSQLPVLYTGSATGPALGMALKRNGERLLSLAMEAGDAIRVAGGRFTSDNRADYDLFLSGYTGEPLTEARISRTLRLEAPCLTVLWAVQPTLLRELYGTAEAQERGLLARFNVVRCDDDITPFDDGVVREVPPTLEAEWDKLIRAALELRKTGRKVTFRAEADAREIFRIFHNECVTLRNSGCRENEAKLKRCRENAIRIAIEIAATEWLAKGAEGDGPTLTAVHAARGVVIAEYFLAQTLNLTRGTALEKRQARLAEVMGLVSQAGGSITLRLLRDHHGVGESEVNQIVARNREKLKIETRNPGAKGGRPSVCLVAVANAQSPTP